MTVAPAALAAAAAIALALPDDGRRGPRAGRPGRGEGLQVARRAAPWACGLLGPVVLPGPAGWIVGLALVGVCARLLGAADTHGAHRDQVLADLPDAWELLAGCVLAGVTPAAALDEVGRVLAEPLGGHLRRAAAGLALGAPPVSAVAGLSELLAAGMATAGSSDPGGVRAFARALTASASGGAALEPALREIVTRTRQTETARAVRRARSVGVRAAGPLGLCFLPAFVLLGVVPLVLSALRGLR